MPTHRRVLRELQRKVAVARGVNAVRRRRSESQLARGHRPVELKRCSGHRARSQWTEVQPRRAILQPVRIAQRHLNVSQQPVRNKDRLGPLQMRVARHWGVAGAASLLDERSGPRSQPVDCAADRIAHIKPQVGSDLFVAAAAGVQLEPKRAYAFHQLELDEVMNVFG